MRAGGIAWGALLGLFLTLGLFDPHGAGPARARALEGWK